MVIESKYRNIIIALANDDITLGELQDDIYLSKGPYVDPFVFDKDTIQALLNKIVELHDKIGLMY